MVAYAVTLLTKEIAQEFEKDSPEVRGLGMDAKDAFYSLLVYTNLFHAEQFFSEQIENSIECKNFIHQLESHFNVESENPKKFLNWIRKVENPLRYFGSEGAKIINKRDDALLSMSLTNIYTSFLLYGFLNGLKRAWSVVSDYPNI